MNFTSDKTPFLMGVQKMKNALAQGVNASGNYELESRLSYENLQGAMFHTGLLDCFVVPADALSSWEINLPDFGNAAVIPRWQISYELYTALSADGTELINPMVSGEASLIFSLLGKPTDNAYGGYTYSLDATGAFDLVDLSTSVGEIIDGANQIGKLKLSVSTAAATAKYLVVCLRAW